MSVALYRSTSHLRCLFDKFDDVFGFVGVQNLPDISGFPNLNELDFLRFLIDNDVGLHGTDSFPCVVILGLTICDHPKTGIFFSMPIFNSFPFFT